MRLVCLLTACAIVGSAAHAETMANLSLGANEARVAAVFPGERFTPTNINDLRVIFNKYYAATLCRGALVGIQQNIGSGIHNYTAAVEMETLRRGKPSTIVTHTQTPDGPSSLISTVWINSEGEAFTVDGYQLGDGEMSIAKRLSDPDGMICAPRRK